MKKKPTTKETLSREFENFLADIDSLVQATGELSGEELQKGREKIHERVAEARDSVAEFSDDLVRRARKSATSVNQEVHEEPWKAIGVGVAIGLLLGLLFARR
jgi:ElaB/YqjD/DUF883 family membrane-anchored ribosome-binding protein